MTGRAPTQPDAAELLALGTGLPPVFAPGEGWNYSNPGYIALGMVLQKVTGHSVSDLIQQNIAGPLGLRHTYLPTNGAARPDAGRLAEGYEPDAAGIAPVLPPGLPAGYGFIGPNHDSEVDVTDINQSWDGAAGAIVSTTSDWARFDTALMTGRLFPKSLLTEMRTVVKEDDLSGPNLRYGLGLEQYDSPCGIVWGHDGALPGYRSDNYTDLSGQRTVSVLATTHFGLKTNTAAGDAEKNVVDAAICTMLDKPVPATS
jgi:D-alanyl-D-alanine carboxypeptidase